MSDLGHQKTDLALKKLQNKVDKAYQQANTEVIAKAQKYFEQFKAKDEKKIADLAAGKISYSDYKNWRAGQMLVGKKWEAMKESLANDLVNTNKTVMNIVYDNMIDVYAMNMNISTYVIERMTKINTNFALYDRGTMQYLLSKKRTLLPKPTVDIPKDKKWNKSKIQSAITQGVLQGESVKDIAKRLTDVVGMDKRAAIRNARTATTHAENAGRLDSYYRAKAMGIAIKKRWMSTLDNVTRDSHVTLDGEIQDIDKPFSNGLDYPAGAGEPAEVYNCRCCMVPEYEKYSTDWKSLERDNRLGEMSYDEWKDMHAKKLAAKKAKQAQAKKATPKQKMKPKQQARAQTPTPTPDPTPMGESDFNRDEWMQRLSDQASQTSKFESWFQKWFDAVPSAEREGVEIYTGSSYRSMNGYLRNKANQISDHLKEAIENCRAALNKASLPEDIIVRRGVDNDGIAGLFQADPSKIKQQIENGTFDGAWNLSQVFDKAFISSSADPDGGFDESFELIIKVKEGTRAMYVDPISRNQGELETLIHDDCVFRVEGAEIEEIDGTWSSRSVTRIFLTLLN